MLVFKIEHRILTGDIMDKESSEKNLRENLKLVLGVILLISSIGQVMSDLYLPSLPSMAKDLKVDTTYIQFTVAVYMVGFCLSQLFYGPLSDAIGRRKPIILGLILCLIGSILCTIAENIWVIYTGRFLQGLGVGSGTALARAILRDLFSDETLAKHNSYIAMASIVILAIAPVLGGYIETYLGWRFNFIFLTMYGATTLVLFFFALNETNKHMHRENLIPKVIKRNLTELFTNRHFIRFALCPLLTYAGILAWLTAAPILLQETIGVSAVEFGYIYLLSGIGFVLGGFINAKRVETQGIEKMVVMGFILQLIAGLIMFISFIASYLNTLVIIVPVMLYMMGSSLVFPNSSAGALKSFPHFAGMAGAIFGFMQVLGGAIASNIFSVIHEENQLPMSIAFILTAGLGIVLFQSLKNK